MKAFSTEFFRTEQIVMVRFETLCALFGCFIILW